MSKTEVARKTGLLVGLWGSTRGGKRWQPQKDTAILGKAIPRAAGHVDEWRARIKARGVGATFWETCLPRWMYRRL